MLCLFGTNQEQRYQEWTKISSQVAHTKQSHLYILHDSITLPFEWARLISDFLLHKHTWAHLWLEKYFNCFGPFSEGKTKETLFVICKLQVVLTSFCRLYEVEMCDILYLTRKKQVCFLLAYAFQQIRICYLNL